MCGDELSPPYRPLNAIYVPVIPRPFRRPVSWQDLVSCDYFRASQENQWADIYSKVGESTALIWRNTMQIVRSISRFPSKKANHHMLGLAFWCSGLRKKNEHLNASEINFKFSCW